MDSSETSNPSPSAEEAEGRKDLLKALFFCIIAVICVRSFLFEPFNIPSSSMVPTLRIGDHIFVSKFNYGLSIPFTKIEFAAWGAPSRGDVIVFLFPRDESLHYIKRVVGVPGDKVEFRGKDIIINGQVVQKRLVSDPGEIAKVCGTSEINGELYEETMGDSVHFVKYAKSSVEDFSRTNKIEIIPPNKFFVAGDNRDDSYDSRAWGYVPRENIKGRAQVIWLSLDQEQTWGRFNKVIRWDRFGTRLR